MVKIMRAVRKGETYVWDDKELNLYLHISEHYVNITFICKGEGKKPQIASSVCLNKISISKIK